MKILGLRRLTTKLTKLADKYGPPRCAVVVGYTQSYAIHVHERQAKHNVGQWKYLETPARQMGGELKTIIQTAVKGGATLPQALLVAGLRLQGESQEKFVPVQTSALKASAFTAPEEQLEQAAAAAFAKSEAVRKKAKG